MATDQTNGQAGSEDAGLPLAEAARRLGVTENALRKRAQRGSVPAAKGADGLWYVFIDIPDGQAIDQATEGGHDQANGQAVDQATAGPDRTDELIASLRAEVGFLRGELTARSEELRRKDHIIAGFVERLPELPAGGDGPTTHPEAPGATGAGAAPFAPSVAAWRARTTREVDLDAPAAPVPWWRRWWRRSGDG